MVNMGELFAYRRISGGIAMERVPLNERSPERDLLAENDLLFARQSLIAEGAGKVSLFLGSTEPTTFESHLIRARADKNAADPLFLFYYFESPQGRASVRSIVQQVAAAGIRGSDLVRLSVPAPPRAEQERISSVLAALDDKIDSNHRLAGLLEETAATLFRAQFVDFVGVEEFDESDIGRAPRGWRIAPISDVLTVVGGSTPSTKEPRFWNGNHCWATPKDLSGVRSPILLDTNRRVTDEGVSQISSKLLPVRTVLLSSRAPVGYTAVSFVDVAVNQGFIAIPPSDGMPSEFVFFWLRQHMDEIKAHAGGTTFAEISKRAFRPLPMLVPPPDLLEAFENVARPLFNQMASLAAEIGTLSRLRNALLPKLVSGEIRVPETADPDELMESGAQTLALAAP